MRAFLIIVFVFMACRSTQAIDLVRDGKPIATIVVAYPLGNVSSNTADQEGFKQNRAGSDEQFAVQTLVNWIKKITDAELLVTNKLQENVPAIYVGLAAVDAGLRLDDISSPSHEGLRIVADERRILIAGQSEAATLKAVCRFLEELGCRYFMDTPLGEVFPRSKTLSVQAINISDKPGLIWRNPKGPSWNPRLWKAWNGAGGVPFGHAHSWSQYVPPSVFEEHTDFFEMGSDGQRKNNGWLCTSNPTLREYFASSVIKTIEKGVVNPSLSPTDGRSYCQCANCKAQDDPKALEPSSGTVSVTNRYLDFFDAVGQKVAQKHPESVLSFYCYADYTQPPTVHRKLGPNMCAMIAPIRYCRLHPPGHPGCSTRMQQISLTDGWSEVASRLGYYNYMYNLADGTLPMFKYSMCKLEFPYLADKGLSYITIEVLSNWHIYGPQIYLSQRLAYNPYANADEIMDDYWIKFYGPKASPHMKSYWMGIDEAQQHLKSHAGCFYGLAQIYTPEFLRHCEVLLDKAASAASGDPLYEQRVALHSIGLRNARAYRAITDAMNKGEFATAKQEYDAILGRLKPLIENGYANREYATAYLKRFLSEPIVQGLAIVSTPNRLLQVMSDRWQFSFDESDTGNEQGFHREDYRDEKWASVTTFNATLDIQGFDKNTVLWYRTRFNLPDNETTKVQKLILFFGEVDGKGEVYVNGQKMTIPGQFQSPKKPGATDKLAREGLSKPRIPFEVDVTTAVHAGENVLALRVDHSTITELSLGGILRPVVLVGNPN